jgi:OmpW family
MKIKSIIFLFFLCCSTLHACDWIAEVRAGYFYPNASKFRKIYRDGGAEGELEISGVYFDWRAWANVGYFQKNGHSIGLHDKTTIRMVPISFGFKYEFLLCGCVHPYVGAGITYTVFNSKNDSYYVKEHVKKGGFGAVVKSGAYFDVSDSLLLDFFVDYYYQKIHFYQSSNTDVGGLRMGLGLGYRF